MSTGIIASQFQENSGKLKIIFVGRIHPIKNLDFLLGALAANKPGQG